MRRSTRRRLCRLIFCLVCALPTLLVAGALIVRQTPAYRAAQLGQWRNALATQLGVEIDIAEFEACGSGRWLVGGLECRDPESHDWLVRVRSADVVRTQRGWLISLGQPQVHAQRLGRLADLLHEHVLCRADARTEPLQIVAPTVELSDETFAESVLDVRGALGGSQDGAELLLEFRASHAAAAERVRLRFVRNRQLDPPATGWELHTDSAGLPCSLAVHWLPALAQLGDTCEFQGSVWCEQRPTGWEADLRGTLRQIDLEQLVTRQFPHKLSGSAAVTLTQCQLRAGRVTHVEGRLSCPQGVISQSLLSAAVRSLGLAQYPRTGSPDPRRFRQLNIDFALNTAGLVLAAPTADATVLADEQGPLLAVRQTEPCSPLSLVHLLVPQVDLQVPATRETAAMVRLLPLPELAPVPATAQGIDYTPLRLDRR